MLLAIVGCRLLAVIVVDFVFKYLTPLFLFLPHLTCLLLCLWKATREFTEIRKETEIPYKFQLYFRVLMTILWRGEFLWTSRNMSRFLYEVSKYICHFRSGVSLRSEVISSECLSVESAATGDATCAQV